MNVNEDSFFVHFLLLDVASPPYYINESSYTVNAFRVQVENGVEDVFFLQSSFTYHDICGPHWWLRSYSSQASAGCKLKAESFFSVLQFLAYL